MRAYAGSMVSVPASVLKPHCITAPDAEWLKLFMAALFLPVAPSKPFSFVKMSHRSHTISAPCSTS